MINLKRASSVVLGMVALGLAGCADSVMINKSEGVADYTADFYVQTAAANGTNGVVVRNGPFGPGSDEAVLAALRARFASGQYRFALGSAAPDWNGYTIVIAFGAATVGNQTQCANPNLPLIPASGRTAVVADYCYGKRTVAEVTAFTGPVSGPNDPSFVRMIGDVAENLFVNRPIHTPAGDSLIK